MYKIYLLLVHWMGSEFTNFGSCWVQVSLKEIYAQILGSDIQYGCVWVL